MVRYRSGAHLLPGNLVFLLADNGLSNEGDFFFQQETK